MFTLWTLGAMYKWPLSYAFEDTEQPDALSPMEIRGAYEQSRYALAVRVGYGVRYKVL